MAYTLYLYKEFPSKSGKTIRLEIFERDYAGSAIELEALSPTPVTLTTDNTNNSVFMPIIKTYLGVNIKDTEQIDYTRLFTPDATKFKVIIKVNGTTEWAGYLTPDSFSQSLQFRSEINLIARDNLGMLSEFTYSSGNTFGTIRSLINASLSVIGFQGTLEYRVKKVDENAVNVLDGYVPLRAYTGKTYQEVLETLLTGIGCQLRYVGANKYAIFDIADLKGYGDTTTSQDFLFIDQSGMMELIPAWKDITISQDYILAEEIISNRLAADDYIFRANRLFNTKIGKQDDPIPQVLIPCYDLLGAGWGGTMAIPSPYDFVGEKPSNILLPIIELPVITAPYIEISNIVPPYNGGLEIQFNVHNAFLAPDEELFSEGILSLTDQLPTNAVNYGGAGIWLYYNVFLESGGKIYDLGNTWQEVNSKSDAVARFFKIDKPVTEEGEDDVVITGSIDVACNITIMSLLEGGTLSLRLYGYNFYGTFYRRDFFDCIVRISDLKFVLKNDEPGGRTTTATIDSNYNLRGDVSLALGEVPESKMNYFSMLGGIYRNLSPYYPPMTGFQRTEAIEYHLSELVGREIAHHYKTQRKKLSGNIINSENFAAMPSFAKPFTDGTLTYALNYGSLDFRNEVMSVELIEVEDYTTEDYTFIDAEIDTGGGESLGSGETEFIQWSAAGNAKRIYELDTASTEDTAGSYAVIDKLGLSAAKKVPLFTLLDQKENLLPATPSDPESKFLNGNKEWSLINLGSGGNSPKVFFTSIDSDVSGYKELSYAPEATTSYCTTILTNEEELCNTFLYPLGVGVELLDAGTWEFDIYAKVSGTAGNVTMRAEVFKRTTGGVETTLFSKSSDIINNTDYVYVKFIYTSPSIAVNSTDRIGVRIYGKNTIAAAITLTWALGDGDASFFVTPLAMRHAQLRGKNDEAGFQHITEGNQTFSGIKTFSGAFTDMVENRNTNLRVPKSAPTTATADEYYLYALDSGFSGETPSGAGTLTSVALTMPTGFSVSGSPITESGTFGVTFASGYRMFTETEIGNKIESSLIGAANGVTPLDSGGKVALQYLPSTLLKYMGVWNASTNSPTLTSPDTNRRGQVWNVSVAGTQFGLDFKLGDWLIYNDSGVAEKSDNSDDVTSVNGYTGAVTLKTSDIAEQTNLYYTDARVKTYSDLNYLGITAKAADSDKLDGQDSTYFATATNLSNHTSATNNPHSVTAAQVGALALAGGTLSGALNLNSGIDLSWNGGWGASMPIITGNSGGLYLYPLGMSLSGNTYINNNVIWHAGNSGTTSFNWSAAKLASTTLLLPQSAPTLSSGEMAIYGLESGFSGETPSGAGSVTSISMVVPMGLSVTPETITESGTFTISYASGYSIPTNTKQSEWDSAYNLRHNAVTLGTANGLSLSTQELSLGLASTSTNGALSSTDWNTFNGKQAKLIGTGTSSLVRVNTLGVIAYDDNTYLTGNQTITLSGIVMGSGTTSITTAIADGALSIAKTNGLQSALDAKMATASYPDLVAIEALTGTSGFLKKTAADTWTLDTNSYALISGATTQDFQVKALTMSGALSGATSGSFSGGVSAASFTSGGNAVLHAGNYSSYAVSLAGAVMSGRLQISNYLRIDTAPAGFGANTGYIYFGDGTLDRWIGYDGNNFALQNGSGGKIIYHAGNLTNTLSNGYLPYWNGSSLVNSVITTNGTDLTLGSGKVTLTENINTNLRIPKVAPTSPTSGEYYFYIVE